MSTGIEIKKRIAAKEEGVTITNDLSSINFVGAGATAAVVGDEVTVTVPGSIGSTAYYLNQTVTQSPYKEFTSVPTTAAEQDTATTIASGATAVIGAYQTPAGVPNTTSIPAGLWQFFLHLYSNVASDDWDVYVEVYKRDLGGIETLLFNTDIEAVTNMSTSTTMYLLDGVFPTTSLLTTDRIVVKVLATNMGSGSQTIHMVTEGSAHYSVGTTTLNQVVGAGSVTSVTGTAPIASSGGTTPAISISQASATTDGYLSSSDWTIFSSKQNALGFTPENVGNKSSNTNLGTSNTLYPTQNAVKVYADNLLGNANALIYKGTIDCSTNPNYPAADAGWLYVASVAGKIGGASGIDVEVGDMIICNTDASPAGTQAAVGANWNIIQKNIVGAVSGPASSVNNNVVFFDGTTGKIIKDSGLTLSGSNTGDETQATIQSKLGTASASTSGYLTSTDWNTFNNKASGNIYTTNGNISADRQVNLNGKNLSFTNGSGVGNFTALLDDGVQVSQLTVDWGQILLDVQGGGTGHNLLIQPTGVTVGGYYRLPNTAPSVGQVLKCTSSGITSWGTDSGLTYFTEAQSTAAPNATVNVDSLTAVASTANADIALVPKGTGAFTLAIPDGTATGGNKRGANAVDLQTARGAAAQVASGANSFAVGFGNVASGDTTIAIGRTSTANANYSIAIGSGAVASGNQSVALGFSCNAVGNESIAMIGGTTSAQYSLAIGNTAAASNTNAVAIGQNTTASGLNSLAVNRYTTADAYCSNAFGNATHTFGVTARSVFGHFNTAAGDCQKSIFALSVRTTNATATTLTVGGTAAGTNNQVILQNNSVHRFKGTIVGKQSGSTTAVSAWDVDGLIVRGANAAATTLIVGNVNLVSNIPAWGTPTLVADTTNGGLQAQVTGALATSIQWTAIIETAEVRYF